MRIMWSQRDPLTRKTGIGNLFVKNLDPSITSGQLQHTFCNYGTILSCKVAEENGKSGFGFVQFNSEESALVARDALHDTLVKGKKIYVSKFVKKSMRTVVHEESSFTNLYVKNLPEDVTEDLILDMFSRFGKVSSIAIMKNDQGKSRGFGFANFYTPGEAMKAVEVLNGSLQGPNRLSVARAQKKAERLEVLKNQHKEIFNCHIEKLKAQSLYVKSLDISVDESKLQKHFSVCGKFISVKVMRHANGISRRFGFVCFSTPEEAKKALHTFNDGVIYRTCTTGGGSAGASYSKRKEELDLISTFRNVGRDRCTCNENNRCLKNTCPCFILRERCNASCLCQGCQNTPGSQVRKEVMLLEPAIANDEKGCRCKLSQCKWKYCSCRKRNAVCTDKCRCKDCLNGLKL